MFSAQIDGTDESAKTRICFQTHWILKFNLQESEFIVSFIRTLRIVTFYNT